MAVPDWRETPIGDDKQVFFTVVISSNDEAMTNKR